MVEGLTGGVAISNRHKTVLITGSATRKPSTARGKPRAPSHWGARTRACSRLRRWSHLLDYAQVRLDELAAANRASESEAGS